MYAIIKSGGKQHRVVTGEHLKLEKLEGEPGQSVTFEDVFLIADGDNLQVGAPTVNGATVTGKIVAQGKGKKIAVRTYKRRKGVRRRLGHRQLYTEVEITGISA